MYETFYGFAEKPFNITPDPKFLFLSAKHQEAISHLLYGIQERGGFIVITGEVGTGKTILCRYLLNQLDERTEGAVILNPNLSALELLKAINEDFGIHSTGETKKELVDELNHFLLSRRRMGHNMVLVIDEAQNLAPAVLEEIRLLSNLETETEKLIQIILLGQPELRESLQLHDLRQLSQRITARYHLTPLSAKETIAYMRHRMGVAGNADAATFSNRTHRKIFAFSGGTPRLINVLCDRLLLAGFAANTKQITPAMVDTAIREVAGDPVDPPRQWLPSPRTAAMAAMALACVGVGWAAAGIGRAPAGSESSGMLAAASAPGNLVAPFPQSAPSPEVASEPATVVPVTPKAPPAAPEAAPESLPSTSPVQAPSPKPAPAPTTAVPAPAATVHRAPLPAPAPDFPVLEPAPVATPLARESEPLEAAMVPPPRPAPAPPVSRTLGMIDPRRDDVPRSHPAPLARDTDAAAERQLISSLFDQSANRVRARTPDVIEETLPPLSPEAAPLPGMARIPAAAALPPEPEALQLTQAKDVAQLVTNLRPFDSRLDAAQGLFRLWGRDFQLPKEANDPHFSDFYKLALSQGMRCSELWANFETLERINLPGILEVFSPSAPASRYVVLAGIHEDGTGTILWGDGGSARVQLQALDECWRRRVFVFWEDREGVGEILREGDEGDPVKWVQAGLQTLGHFTGELTGVYDPATRRAVMDFQNEYRLLPDGIVGPRTRMVLYSRLGRYPTPNLAPLGDAVREYHPRRPAATAG